jgi:hypothetical protein
MTTVSIRPAEIGDRSFLLSTMRSTLLRKSAYCAGLHPEAMNVILEPVLATFSAAVLTTPKDPNTILGFIVWKGQTVAFVYVRDGVRRKGFGRKLIEHAGIKTGVIEAPFLVTKIDPPHPGARPGTLTALAKGRGFELHFRPYLPLDLTARLLVPAPDAPPSQ